VILIVDNYDSFVHNLARYVRECGRETVVVRNDAVTVDDCLSLAPAGVIISPGPGRPANAGLSTALICDMPCETPLLGVCLGHQCLIEAFGGETRRAVRPLHGEASAIRHCKTGIFRDIASPTLGGRYHSLIATLGSNSSLEETAWSEEAEVMAVAHHIRPWFGVQFHPESLLTPEGRKIVMNFLSYCTEEGSS